MELIKNSSYVHTFYEEICYPDTVLNSFRTREQNNSAGRINSNSSRLLFSTTPLVVTIPAAMMDGLPVERQG